jgi:hypothetical protein
MSTGWLLPIALVGIALGIVTLLAVGGLLPRRDDREYAEGATRERQHPHQTAGRIP